MTMLRESTTSAIVICIVHSGFSLSSYLCEHKCEHLPFELPPNILAMCVDSVW
jgi:hypothetical protein